MYFKIFLQKKITSMENLLKKCVFNFVFILPKIIVIHFYSLQHQNQSFLSRCITTRIKRMLLLKLPL